MPVPHCPLCGSEKNSSLKIITQEKNTSKNSQTAIKCAKCGVIFAENFADDREFIYGDSYGAWSSEDEDQTEKISEAKKSAFGLQLRELQKYIRPEGKKLLDMGTGYGFLLEAASPLGFDCFGIDISSKAVEVASRKFPAKIVRGDIASAGYGEECFDAVAMTDVLEHLSQPHETFGRIKKVLKPGGLLLIISPNSDSLTRKLFGKRWFQYKYEHVLYYNKKSLSYLLDKHGLDLLEFKLNYKRFNLAYYQNYFKKYSFFGLGKIANLVLTLLPERAKSWHFSNPCTGEFIAVARKNINKSMR